jgi:hypothetical protein
LAICPQKSLVWSGEIQIKKKLSDMKYETAKLEQEMNRKFATLIAAAMTVTAAGAANAATVTLTTSAGPAAGAQVETFDELALGVPAPNTNLAGISGAKLNVTGTQPSEIVQGSVANQYVAPFPTGGVDTTHYLAVYGGGSATFTLSHAATYLGLLWGSVDDYNTIKFLDAANNVLTTFTGLDFISHEGNQAAAGTFYANFNSSVPFSKIVMTSGANAFEVDNVSISTVPLPAALPLFGAAVAGMSFLGRKRAKAKAAS